MTALTPLPGCSGAFLQQVISTYASTASDAIMQVSPDGQHFAEQKQCLLKRCSQELVLGGLLAVHRSAAARLGQLC